jgi:hypothetical protein
VEFDLIVEHINYQAYYSCVHCFINGGKAKCVESMVFDVKGQVREGGMQSFATMLFCTTRIKCFSIWAINMMAMGELEL